MMHDFNEYIQEEERFPLLDHLQLLWFERRLIAAITIFVGGLGLAWVNQLTHIYSSSSSLMIGVTQSQVVDIEAVLSGVISKDVSGEIEVLRSRGLATKVIENLDLLNYEEFNPSLKAPYDGNLAALNPKNWIPDGWIEAVKKAIGLEVRQAEKLSEAARKQRQLAAATDLFLKKFSVRQVERSNVVSITFESPNPEMSARIANELPEAYIVNQLQAKFDATENATKWLTEQLAELKGKVAASEKEVEDYREEHGLTKGVLTGLLTEQLSEINSQMITARAEKEETQARLSQISRLLDNDEAGRLETAVEVLASPLIQQLRSQEAVVMRRASELAVEYGLKHPRMLQVRAEITDIKERIGEEFNKIASGLQNELELARTRERSLEASLRDAEQESGTQNRQAVQLRALEREAAANRTLFETFLNRFKETSSTQGMDTPDSMIISRAEVPFSPSYPNKKNKLIVITMMGFMLGVGLVLVLQFLKTGLLSPEQIEQELNVHTLGVIPNVPDNLEPFDYVLDKPHSGLVEAINSLKISLDLSDPDRELKVLQITSSVPDEGKTSLAISLARIVAESGKKVVLIDGDLRRPSIARKLGLPKNNQGLSDLVLSAENSLTEYLIKDQKTDFHLLPTGTAEFAQALDIFSSKRMQSIIVVLKSLFDFIIIDTPPVMAVADARVVGKLADKTLFVVQWDKTPIKVAKAALQQLQSAGANVAGVVLQRVDLKRYAGIGYGDSGYYYLYGRYGQYYSE